MIEMEDFIEIPMWFDEDEDCETLPSKKYNI